MIQSSSHQPELVTLGRLALGGSDFERTKPLLLLCYLCLEGPQERRHLAELFWPRATNALASLSTELSRLKKHVGEVFEADDVRVYPRLRSDAKVLLDAAERKEYGRAAALYAGDFLLEVSAQEVSAELREWIERTRMFVAACVCEARLTLGERAARSGDFMGAAQHVAEASEPLMLASNTEQLRRAYTLLVAGEHPRAAKLREHADALGLPELTLEAARQRLRPNQRTLPTYSTSFVGRSSEVRTVTDLLRGEARLATIVGLAGMGKSRLAVEVIREVQAELFADIYPVWLVALTKEDEVLSALAGALRLELDGSDVLGQIAQHLALERCLLYFDNFEHVIGAAPVLSELLTRCPNLKVLVTSRERLNLEEEWVVWLEGLPGTNGAAGGLSEAAQLFVQRAKRADLTFSPTEEDAWAIEAVCRRVEGSPLALELAASWTRLMSCADIAAQLEESQEVLRTSLRNVPERHRSIEAAFEYSWRLLSDEERRVLRELAVFRGGFSREAAKEVVRASLPTFVSLVDKSLLVARDGGRFGRHPLLYEFTKRKLARDSQAEAVRKKHAGYFKQTLETSSKQLGTRAAPEILKNLAEELTNILIAWQHQLIHQQGDDIDPDVLRQFYIATGRCQEGVATFSKFMELMDSQASSSGLAGDFRVQLAQMYEYLGQLDLALHQVEAGLAAYRGNSEDEKMALALGLAGAYSGQLGAFQKSLSYLGEGVVLAQRLGDRSILALNTNALAMTHSALGNIEAAEKYYLETLDTRRALEDLGGTVKILNNLGDFYIDTGKFARAEAYLKEGLALCEQREDRSRIPFFLFNLARAARLNGRSEAGRTYVQRGLELERQTGNERLTPLLLVELAYLERAANKAELAESHLRKALMLTHTSTRTAQSLLVLGALAEVWRCQGREEDAVNLATFVATHPSTFVSDQKEAERTLRLISSDLQEAQRLETRSLETWVSNILVSR